MLFHFGTLADQHTDTGGRRRMKPSRDLAVYLLTPGFSHAYHQQALGVSDTTVAKYVQWSREVARIDLTILQSVRENVASITAEDGLMMAQRRGAAHLPWWSRLAIAEFRDRLMSTSEVASLFECSRRTVQLVLKTWPTAYDPLSGKRRLSRTQASPPGMWRSLEGQSCR
jgi:hypothetical protein